MAPSRACALPPTIQMRRPRTPAGEPGCRALGPEPSSESGRKGEQLPKGRRLIRQARVAIDFSLCAVLHSYVSVHLFRGACRVLPRGLRCRTLMEGFAAPDRLSTSTLATKHGNPPSVLGIPDRLDTARFDCPRKERVKSTIARDPRYMNLGHGRRSRPSAIPHPELAAACASWSEQAPSTEGGNSATWLLGCSRESIRGRRNLPSGFGI